MATSDALLSHPSVNSGNGVELNGVEVNFAWKNNNTTKPVLGTYDIAETSYEGFENPKIILRGVIDIDAQSGINTPATNPVTSKKLICQKLLVDFAAIKSTTPLTLTIFSGNNATQNRLGGRPAGGYNSSGSNTLANTLSVAVESFDVRFGTSSAKEGQRWDYSITFVETK